MASPLEQLKGKYEILEKLSEGGMGSVYMVRHRLLDEVRVIKAMRPHLAEDDVLRARFVREAKTAIRLRHPNIAQIYDFTMDDEGYFFLVMEFIDGMDLVSLVNLVDQVPLSVVLEIAHQGLGVLGYLHRKDIIHRDISPDNLLVSRDDDGRLLVKLIDLGIAKVDSGEENLTATGAFLGKVRYSAPEQFQTSDGSDITPRSDLYSFGVVMYELLTRKYPILGNNIPSLITGHLTNPPIPFEESDPNGLVPEDLRKIVLQAMAKDPDDRFPSARSFRTKIGELKNQHPVTEEDIRGIFEVSSMPTTKIRIIKPGSTQDRIQKEFGVETTPARSTRKATKGRRTKPTTTEVIPSQATEVEQPSKTSPTSQAGAQQVKALLLGVEKLLEAHHFQEARLQLDAAESIDPDSTEIKRLREAVDSADTVLQNRRKEAVEAVEKFLELEKFDLARSRLTDSQRLLGSTDAFTELSKKIDKAEVFATERKEQVSNILATARKLLYEKEWFDVAPLAREAIVLEPGNSEAAKLLEAAETGIEQERQAEERREALQNAVATIRRLIDDEEPEQAQKTLNTAHRHFGTEAVLKPFAAEIESLRTQLERRNAEAKVDDAARLMEEQSFSEAINQLEDAVEVLGESGKASELLAGAREGLRLQEEARKRQRAIDQAALSIDRLVLAGRLESAYRVIDVTEDKVGDFDLAEELRVRVGHEISSREKAQKKLDGMIKKVKTAIADHNFAMAEEELSKTRDLTDRFPELSVDVEETAREVRRKATDHRRSVEINAAVSSIRQRLEASDLNGADRELRLASRLYGGEPVFEGLHDQLKKARTQQKIAKLISQAEKADPKEALDLLQQAVALDPADTTVEKLVETAKAAVESESREHRARLIEQAMEPIDALIADGRLDEALSAVKAAVNELGDFPAAHGLRQRLQEMLKV